jgi:S-layer homology domain
MWRFVGSGGLMLALVAFAVPALAQGPGAQTRGANELVVVEPRYEAGRTFGTASEVVLNVQALLFYPPTNFVGFEIYQMFDTGIALFSTVPTIGDWWASVHLPAGALVDRIELEACDTNPAGAIEFGMVRGSSPAGAAVAVTPTGSTGVNPGCAFFPLSLTAPLTIDNRNNNYWLFKRYGATDSTNRVNAIRVFYRLQVSPAPAVATFPNDVPTSHVFFRFIEALARAGVTAGCGPGAYCPDAPLTRGQMAVFLSIALGLHFPDQ